jgi:hypothetical protein
MVFTFDIDPTSWATVALGTTAAILAAIQVLTQAPTLGRRAKALVGAVIPLGVIIAVIPFIHNAKPNHDAAQLSFVQPPNGGQRCNIYQGLGKVPDGYDVLVFDRPVDANGNGEGSSYYLDGKALKVGTNWQTPHVDAGSANVEVSGVLVNSELAAYLTTLKIVGPNSKSVDASWISANLPPGSHVDPPIVTSPNPSTPAC